MRFIDTIEGLNKVFLTDIPKNSVVLITGAPGTLKSGFTFSMLSSYLKAADEYGLYITLEESKANHIRNMEHMGVKLTENLGILDYSDYRLQFDEYSQDLISTIETQIMQYKRKWGAKFTCVALDSLGALYSLMDEGEDEIRKRLYHLFEPLRRENLTSFVIFESFNTLDQSQSGAGIEGYLADGIIELGISSKQNVSYRFIRVLKMRAATHSMDPWVVTVSDQGLKIYKGIS
ncbi:RAD55 family ATPase [Methanolobus profundi]|uniref:RecA-superfamily ATPase, KaiC/GvpD/RAD55 family n=1 Tax=Methanolobus profundi TaxID=487685 RepID=A0A1I4T4I8_9EURY|nr:ATPase domain-containing protein [Methanolobus profundi]SFM71545.1 RecA-superfamily ATPase, KaiC/GvpD/RAD55 family [Methanolobus profundi]